MFRDLGEVDLRTGERVAAGVVVAPDDDWADRIERMLVHKRDPWNWQNTELLRRPTGLRAYFYVLHRNGAPFANIMTAEAAMMGLLGHVWTDPPDRRKGAIAQLMALAMADVCGRGIEAVCLGTDYDTPPYHIYRSFGFEGIEPMSGYMNFYRSSEGEFYKRRFAKGPRELVPLAWRDWPTLPFLFTGDFSGTVRCASVGLIGRRSSEEGMLALLRAPHEPNPRAARTVVLRERDSGTAVGLAACAPDPIWPGAMLIDVYCGPDDWAYAPELLTAVDFAPAKPCTAYDDGACPEKTEALKTAGFRVIGDLSAWAPSDAAQARWIDVSLMRRCGRAPSP